MFLYQKILLIITFYLGLTTFPNNINAEDSFYRRRIITQALDKLEGSYSFRSKQRSDFGQMYSDKNKSPSTAKVPEINSYPYARDNNNFNPWESSNFSEFRKSEYNKESSRGIYKTITQYFRPGNDLENERDFWINSFDYGLVIETDQKPRYYFEGLLPFYQKLDDYGDHHVWFTQGRVSGYSKIQNSYSLGLGYRKLIHDQTMIVGLNTFFDYRQFHRHYRAGYGLELLTHDFDFRANFYHALSGNRVFEDTIEVAVDGFDLEMGTPMPFISNLKLFGGYSHYYYDYNPNPRGWTMRLEYKPRPYLISSFEAMDRNDDDIFYRLDTRLTFNFFNYPGENSSYLSDSDYDFDSIINKDISSRIFERVEREFNVRYETYNNLNSGGGGGGNQVGNLKVVQMVSYFTGIPRICASCLDNNSNGLVDPGDGFEIDFLLTNNSNTTATGISFANATVSTGWSFEFNTSAVLPDAPPGGTSRTGDSTDLDLVIPGLTANGTSFTINADFTSDGDTQNLTFGPFVVGSISHNQTFNTL